MGKANLIVALTLGLVISLSNAAEVQQDPASLFVAQVRQATQFAGNQVELATLVGPRRQLFSDFCIKSRELINSELRSSASKVASQAYKMITEDAASSVGLSRFQTLGPLAGLGSMGGLLQRPVDLLGDLVGRASQGLARLMGQSSAPSSSWPFGGSTSRGLGGLAGDANPVEQVRAVEFLACHELNHSLIPRVERLLAQTRADLLARRVAQGDRSSRELVAKTKLDNVGCLTAGQLALAGRQCRATMSRILRTQTASLPGASSRALSIGSELLGRK